MPERKLKVKSQKSKVKGFTLVELLVVISIIAILSTVGIVSFTRVQQVARDGKRVADIDSIAKSLETSKDFSTGIYYNKLSTDFPNGIPVDPKRETRQYCLLPGNSLNPFSSIFVDRVRDPTRWPDTTVCPDYFLASWAEVSDSFRSQAGPVSDVRHWLVCAKKESNAEIYCKQDLSP